MEGFQENSKRFLVKHPPLTDEEAEVGPFYGTTKMLFLMEKKKKGRRLMISIPLYQWFQNKKYLNVLGILKNINSFRNFPYLKTPVGLLIPQTNHCLVLSKNCQTRS